MDIWKKFEAQIVEISFQQIKTITFQRTVNTLFSAIEKALGQ